MARGRGGCPAHVRPRAPSLPAGLLRPEAAVWRSPPRVRWLVGLAWRPHPGLPQGAPPAAQALGGLRLRPRVTAAGPRLAAAAVDRPAFRAHIIETGSESYRLRVTSAATGGAPAR